MTTATDSDTPSSQPAMTMIEMTEVTINMMLKIETSAWIQFIVANNNTKNAKMIEIIIP